MVGIEILYNSRTAILARAEKPGNLGMAILARAKRGACGHHLGKGSLESRELGHGHFGQNREHRKLWGDHIGGNSGVAILATPELGHINSALMVMTGN